MRVQSLLLCEGLWADPATGKLFILGCFESITAEVLPVSHDFLVYAELHDAEGVVNTKVSVLYLDSEGFEDEEVAALEQDVTFSDRLAVVRGAFVLNNVPFEHAGEYRVRLEAKGAYLAEKRLIIVLQGDVHE